MSSNPIAKAAYMTAKSVRRNKAVIQYRHESVSLLTGVVSSVAIERDIYLKDIGRVADWLVATGAYQSGDLRASIPSLFLSRTRGALATDPEVLSGSGDAVGLSDIRPWRESTGGMVSGVDRVKWNGDVYAIIRIEPTAFWYGTPASYVVGLRRVEA